jgi:hypothetical protein
VMLRATGYIQQCALVATAAGRGPSTEAGSRGGWTGFDISTCEGKKQYQHHHHQQQQQLA